MAFDYTELAKVATQLIKDSGMQMLLRNTFAGETFDPVAGSVTPGGAVDTPFNGVKLVIDESYAKRIGHQNILLRDELVYMEPTVVQPTPESKVVVDGIVWSVVNIETYRPTTIPLLYILQVRP